MMGIWHDHPDLPFYIKSFGASGARMGFLMGSLLHHAISFRSDLGQSLRPYGRKPLLLSVYRERIGCLSGLGSSLWLLGRPRRRWGGIGLPSGTLRPEWVSIRG